jgi:hypothetical protein
MADSSYSLTSQTLSSTRSAFPVVTPELHSVLSRIVARVPVGSTSFSDLFKAYNEVVLHPQDDVEIYGAILKLGLEKGSDFHQKWASVTASQGVSDPRALPPVEETEDAGAGGKLDILKARLDQLDRSVGDTLETPKPSTGRRPVSDKWEALEGPHHSGPFSTPPPLGSRKRTSRSTISNDTPAADRHIHHHKRSHPMSSTPVKGRARPTSAPAEYESNRTPLHQTRKADQFRNLSLLGHALDVWREKAAFVKVSKNVLSNILIRPLTMSPKDRAVRTAQAHDAVLVRSCLRHWHVRLVRCELINATASEYARKRLVREALHYWRTNAKAARRQRWETEIRVAWETFSKRRRARILDGFWEVSGREHFVPLKSCCLGKKCPP